MSILGSNGEGRTLGVGESVYAGQLLVTGSARAALAFTPRKASGEDSGTARTTVRLDQGTRLRFLDDAVLLLDAGAIYVDTAGAAGARLRVETSLGVVEDIGTQFEVRCTSSGLRVRIREGAVILHHERGSYEVRQGEELVLEPGASLLRTNVSPWDDPWQWMLEVAPAASFDGETLGTFLDWVARETGSRIRFSDPALGEAQKLIRVSGDIAGLPVLEALETVLPVCDLIHRFEGGELVIERAEAPLTAREGGGRGG